MKNNDEECWSFRGNVKIMHQKERIKKKRGELRKMRVEKNADLKTFGNFQKSKIMNEKGVMMVRETKEDGESQCLEESRIMTEKRKRN